MPGPAIAEYCAIRKGSKKAEDGRRAPEHTRAERLVVWNFGEEDMKATRVILAANGIYAVDMTDIDAMGIPDPEGHPKHIDDWKSNDGREAHKPGPYCPIWLHEDQASSRNITYEMDPLKAWGELQTPHKS